ncbi:MAG: hypothetical protein N2037_14530, partial [Acidimicrobiales bacterium]|nr:hypothetical protein [Acidimicrobiales bacterium]
INGEPNPPLPNLDESIDRCVDVGLRVTDAVGEWQSVPVRVEAPLGAVLGGETVRFHACDELLLEEGWHLLNSGPATAIESVELRTTDVRHSPAGSGSGNDMVHGDIEWLSPTRVRVTADLPDGGATVVFQQSWAKGWLATVNGASLGSAKPFDTMNGWKVPLGGPVTIDIRYRGQVLFGIGLFVTIAALVVCACIVFWHPRRPGSGVRPGAVDREKLR